MLARPVSRPVLLVAKYFGGLWFVLVVATFLVVGCWAAFALRMGYSNPWFLASIVTITLQFAVLHAVSVLMGVLTRSSGVAALVTLGVWMVSGLVVNARHAMPMLGDEAPSSLVSWSTR